MSYEYAYQPVQAPPPQRRKRRVFWWIFLGLQLIFIAWIAGSLLTRNSGCTDMSVRACHDISTTAHGAAVGVIVVFWIVADFLTAVVYGIYRLARRPGR